MMCPEPGTLNSCGGSCPPCPTLVMIATTGNGGRTSSFVSGVNWSSVSTVDAMTSDVAPAFAIRSGKNDGVAVFRSTATGSLYKVGYSKWNAGTGFGTVDYLNTMSGLTEREPAAVSSADAVHVSFRGNGSDHKYHYSLFNGVTFNPLDEIVKDNNTTSLGICSPALTIVGSDVVILNPGDSDESLYTRTRKAGVWDGGFNFDTTANGFQVDDVTPPIVSLASSPELLAVVTRKNVAGKPLYYFTRTNNVWTGPMLIPGSPSSIEMVLLALPTGGALLVYRDYNGNPNMPMKLSWARFDGTAWSAIKDVGAGVTAKSKPALALGAGDAEVELLYIDMDGQAQHARLRKNDGNLGNFTDLTPIPNATNLVGIAAATNL